jgi:competence protein ComEA
MFYQWTTREKKLIICIAILGLVLISLFLSSWIGERGATEIDFALQSVGQDASQEANATTSPAVEEKFTAPEAEPNEIAVDIKGAVKHPNVYFMKEGMRVIDVIMRAGNLVEDGTTTTINLAQKLEDGMLIYIPTKEELEGDQIISEFVQVQNTGSTSTQTNSSTSSSGKININRASLTELEGLPGIGPSRAKAIITYRDEKGKFSTADEIMNISGIGPKIYENIKDLIEH